ncbi:Mannosyl-D-glycerate transport/metabolism system repressor MngR [Nonomuraea coxensis DSM 45129]|uniref:Mannosyl-D-glycerate transport/metabolism system repressor MngR n=1 Tax=Nonomuraea coxensis DSM 45129 TaxID=1122611 RepID=A0ABX8UAX5_9ACTN|nr:winged helix-turn-helix domain-containing protein [Nonomuraea coxensis]QYC44931.1 Mannosyl-D-glycerate transport/metabolism system repressor MngR [Nonomuraea coxensis DSM 45129]
MSDDQEFDPEAVQGEYVYRAAADYLEARIRDGRIPPGSRLPGERALVEQMHIALGTVRRTTRELVERGLVRVLPGKGVYVLPADEWPQE